MSVGFGLLFYGIVRSMNNPSNLQASYVSAVAGIITEFIGLTFMVIYRSTLAQAGSFMTILERINAVGMAVQILDSISNTHDDLKNVTRAELVKMLLNTGSSAWERNVVGGETGHKPRGSAIRPAKLIQRSEVSPQPEPSNE
jgi:hypothetical protein